MYSERSFLAFFATVVALAQTSTAFSPSMGPGKLKSSSQSSSSATMLYSESSSHSTETRRAFLSTAFTTTFTTTAAAAVVATAASPQVANAAAAASTTKDSLVSDLMASQAALKAIPDLLAASEWEKVRQILKTPPVNQLWNLGDNQNTLVKLAKETGDFEYLEMKDELAISLQMCDQYTYDNVFVYYQPGNGKFKVKEPTDMAKKAMSQLKEVLDLVGSN